jgi:hypothetical protein
MMRYFYRKAFNVALTEQESRYKTLPIKGQIVSLLQENRS